MGLRHVLAGPSRLPFPAPSRPSSILFSTFPQSRSARPHPQKRYLLQIPHPLLDPKNGTTRVKIRTTSRLPSTLHAFAIMRSLQDRFGKVTAIQVTKNVDDYTPGRIILLTFLRPIKLEKPLLMEIPTPKVSPASNDLGGPSLDDILAILNGSAELPGYEGKSDGGTISFEVSALSKAEHNPPRTRQKPRPPTSREIQEDAAIVEALEAFGDGFYGGFAGLAQRYKHLKIRSPEASPEEASFGLVRNGAREESGVASVAINASEAGSSSLDPEATGAVSIDLNGGTQPSHAERPKSLFGSLPKTHSEASFPGSSPPPLPSSSSSSSSSPRTPMSPSRPKVLANPSSPSSSRTTGSDSTSGQLKAKREDAIARAVIRLQSENEQKAMIAQKQLSREKRMAEEAEQLAANERARQAEIDEERKQRVKGRSETSGGSFSKKGKANDEPVTFRGQGEDMVEKRREEREKLDKMSREEKKKSTFRSWFGL